VYDNTRISGASAPASLKRPLDEVETGEPIKVFPGHPPRPH